MLISCSVYGYEKGIFIQAKGHRDVEYIPMYTMYSLAYIALCLTDIDELSCTMLL